MHAKRANFISLKDASALCDYSPDYLNLIARKGYLKAVKVGRNWVTKKEWVLEYLSRIEKKHSHANGICEVAADDGKVIPEPSPPPVPEHGEISGFAMAALDLALSRPPRPRCSLRVGSRASFASIAFAALIAFGAVFLSQKDIFIAGVSVSFAALHHETAVIAQNYAPPKNVMASIGDASGNVGHAFAAAIDNILAFGKSAGSEFFGFVRYVFFGKTEVVEVKETKTTSASGEVDKTVLEESTNALEENIVGDTRERIDDFREEFGLPAGEGQAGAQGMVVVPAAGNESGDEALKENIKKKFSDDVTVEASDDGSGVVVPQFRDGPGDEYIYMLVPVDGDQ